MSNQLKMTTEWDKVFPKSDEVSHEKIQFHNRFGIQLAADLYKPKDTQGELPAIAVSGPFGAVKEQSSGLYAQEMAKRGYLAIAFDPSFTGESGGETRNNADPSINTEDFQAAVDYLANRMDVDSEKISIIGICGWGGIALNTASLDTRIKATIVSTMYDLTRVSANGYFDSDDSEEKRFALRKKLNTQRSLDYKNGTHARAGGVADPVPEEAPDFLKQYHAYYKTARGYHSRSLNSNDGWNSIGTISYMNTRFFTFAHEIRSAVLFLHGENAHSLYLGEDAYALTTKNSNYKTNKEFLKIPDATHTDLYDQLDKIPFDKIDHFIQENL